MNNNLLNNYKKALKNNSYIYRVFQEDFDYQDYKMQAYGNKSIKTKKEQRRKDSYDAYIYLLENRKRELSEGFLNKFIYILFNKEDQELANKIKKTYYFPSECLIKKLVEMHKMIMEIRNYNDEEKYILAILINQYIKFKEEERVISMNLNEMKELYKTKKEEKELESLYLKMIHNQEKEEFYIPNIKETTTKEVIQTIKSQERVIRERYGIKKISLFGSFSKGNYRIDSDIDLLVSFEDWLTYKEKKENTKKMKEYLLGLLNRRIDILEYSYNAEEEILQEINEIIKIY